MKTNKCLVCALVLTLGLVTVPAFAQVGGVGVGVGVGGQAKAGGGVAAGVGSQVGATAQPGGTTVGVKTGTDAHANPTDAQVRSNSGVATRIQSNPELAARVQSMLPSGMSMNTASAGFKNEGQFLATLHASQNLNIPFEQLKTKMTGSAAASLGSAIQASKPGMTANEAKTEARRAETEAKATAAAKADVSSRASASASGGSSKQQ
jgi:hypothetical protein